VNGLGQLVAERNVEGLGVVIFQRTVVCGQVVDIHSGTVAVSVGSATVAGTQDLAEGEVGEQEQVAGLLLRGDLQRVVVCITSMRVEVNLSVVVEWPVILSGKSGPGKWARVLKYARLRIWLEVRAVGNQVGVLINPSEIPFKAGCGSCCPHTRPALLYGQAMPAPRRSSRCSHKVPCCRLLCQP
jgi:hypothetical protein